MFEADTVFQRTHAGREEIHLKKRGLTQSVRLVLIMVDGVASYSGVRAKLPVLTQERFERAMRTLQEKELILEVFLPVDGQSPEEVERTVIDLFLQQDPMDPVTVFMMDPDDLLETPAPQAPLMMRTPAPEKHSEPTAAPASAVFNQQDVEMVEMIGRQARERQREKPAEFLQHEKARERSSRRRSRESEVGEEVNWGYWVALGLAFLGGYILALVLG